MLIFIIFLFIVGIYFSIKLKFNNLNLIKMVKSIIKKDDGISTFSSLCISLASKIGVGSLSGVAFSIYVGGVGSIFWMWITTIICSSNTMAECILSVKHRITVDNNYEGGPFYYIKDKLLAFCYAFFLALYRILRAPCKHPNLITARLQRSRPQDFF